MPSMNQNKKYLGQGSEVPSWEQKLQGFMSGNPNANRPELPGRGNVDDTYKSALAVGGGGAGMGGNNGRGRGFGRGLGRSNALSATNPLPNFGGGGNGLQGIFQEMLRRRKKFGQVDQPPQPSQNRLLSRYLGGSE